MVCLDQGRQLFTLTVMIDLHCHSTASDGRLSPADLIRHAKAGGLRALVLTDHDTTAGVAEARAEAKRQDLVFLAGTEIEINFPSGEFHLLALGLQDTDSGLEAALAGLREKRSDRNLRIWQKMKDAGVGGDYADVVALAGDDGMVGRPHLARYLIQRGRVKTIKEAFDKFLGKGQMFYEKKDGLDLETALPLIKRAGGTAIAAHPMSLYLSMTKLEENFAAWKDLGLDGLEAFHPGAPLKKCLQLEDIGRRLGLRISAGSDFHGENRPDRRLGYTVDNRPISDDFWSGVLGISLPSADN